MGRRLGLSSDRKRGIFARRREDSGLVWSDVLNVRKNEVGAADVMLGGETLLMEPDVLLGSDEAADEDERCNNPMVVLLKAECIVLGRCWDDV